MMCGVNIW